MALFTPKFSAYHVDACKRQQPSPGHGWPWLMRLRSYLFCLETAQNWSTFARSKRSGWVISYAPFAEVKRVLHTIHIYPYWSELVCLHFFCKVFLPPMLANLATLQSFSFKLWQSLKTSPLSPLWDPLGPALEFSEGPGRIPAWLLTTMASKRWFVCANFLQNECVSNMNCRRLYLQHLAVQRLPLLWGTSCPVWDTLHPFCTTRSGAMHRAWRWPSLSRRNRLSPEEELAVPLLVARNHCYWPQWQRMSTMECGQIDVKHVNN